jgi:hypothetical protein
MKELHCQSNKYKHINVADIGATILQNEEGTISYERVQELFDDLLFLILKDILVIKFVVEVAAFLEVIYVIFKIKECEGKRIQWNELHVEVVSHEEVDELHIRRYVDQCQREHQDNLDALYHAPHSAHSECTKHLLIGRATYKTNCTKVLLLAMILIADCTIVANLSRYFDAPKS